MAPRANDRSRDRLPESAEELDRVVSAAVDLLRRALPAADWIGIYERDDDGALRLAEFHGDALDQPFLLEAGWPGEEALREQLTFTASGLGASARRHVLYVPFGDDTRLLGCMAVAGPDADRFSADVERVARRLGACYATRSGPLAVAEALDGEAAGRPGRAA